ncbi:HET-domain-containing protein [Xylariaceae sp. FL0255]|nr:HET-domain-containing protein [Xylariaceae sp. FL0255]
MSLCSLCRGIPFASLADPPTINSCYLVNDNDEMPMLILDHDQKLGDKPQPDLDTFAFPWHPNLGALAKSTASCPLCAVVQSAVEDWLAGYEEAQKSPSFIEFHADFDVIPQNERLWITKRNNGAAGLLVFAHNPASSSGRYRRRVYLIAGVGFSVEAENPAAGILPSRPIHADSASSESLDTIGSFRRSCDASHELCSQDDSALPSRVLDIDGSGDVIKLVEPEDQTGRYACLSYCGDKSPFITSRESMQARRSGISLDQLPKTIYDGVVVARRLGVRYLWVDAICICQDDNEDWARESSRMIDIYSGADLVIAADRASDSHQGCFSKRSLRPSKRMDLTGYANDVYVQAVYVSDETGFASNKLQNDPLSSRAWALQERVLARRILHFSERQMYFEFHEGIVSEDGGVQRDRFCNISNPLSTEETRNSLGTPDQRMWELLVWQYGERKLTRATDKFPAMSGLARVYEKKLKAKYVAGLWDNNLITGLSWQGLGNRAPEADSMEYIGPSWSWASFGGIAATGRGEEWTDISEVLEWHVKPKTEANPYGELKEAWIRLRGPMAALAPAKKVKTEHEARLQRAGISPLPRVQTVYHDPEDEEGAFLKLDYEEIEKSGRWKELGLHVLLLAGYFETETQIKSEKPEETSEDKTDFGDKETPTEKDDQEEKDKKEDDGQYYGLVVAKADDCNDDQALKMKRLG